VQGEDLAHDLAHAMRSALARAELAAGQIERDAATPRARRLAGSVSGAVAELDRLVSEAVALLARGRRSARCEDLRSVVTELRRRHAGALAARDVEWNETPLAGPAPCGDPALARRAGALLLRVAAPCARAGGRLAIELGGEDAGWSIAARVEARDRSIDPAPEGLAELRALARRTGGVFEHARAAGATVLRLRVPNEAAAWPAS